MLDTPSAYRIYIAGELFKYKDPWPLKVILIAHLRFIRKGRAENQILVELVYGGESASDHEWGHK
jgi:hypothetical protein